MLPSPASQESSTSLQRGAKLRAACNACCAAKLKCTGEKTGCARCSASGSECIYAESRVGKNPGIRASRKQSQSSMTNTENCGNQSTVQQAVQVADASTNNFHDATFFEPQQMQMLSWEDETQLGSSHQGVGFLDDSTLTASEFNNFQELLQTPPPTVEAREPPPPQPSLYPTAPLSLGLRPRNEEDSKCALDACQILSDLENYLVADLKAFGLLLQNVRNALESLTTLIARQQGSRNLRCLFIFLTIMYQVLELLEACVASVRRVSESLQNSIPTASTSGIPMPSLGLGGFGMAPRDQIQWRFQTLLRETNNALDVLKRLKQLAGFGPDEPARAEGSRESRSNCYKDIELRFEELSSRISSFA